MDLRHVFWSMRGHSTYLPGKGGNGSCLWGWLSHCPTKEEPQQELP